MDSKTLEHDVEDIVEGKSFCRKIAVFFAISNIILVLAIALKGQIVIVNPPEMHEAYEISRAQSTEAYQKGWALGMSKLVGNITKSDAPYVIKQLSTMMTEETYNKTRKALYAHIEMLQKKKITTKFTVKHIYTEEKTKKVFVYGEMELDSLVSNKKDKLPFTFEYIVKVSSYQPAIAHFDFYQGKPRAPGINYDKEALEAEQKGEKGA